MHARMVVALAAGLLLAAPSTRAVPAGPAADGGDAGHEAVVTYLNQLLDIMEANSINRSSINWPSGRAKVLAQAASARTIPEARRAIEAALFLLGEEHSYVKLPDGSTISGSVTACDPPAAPPPDLPPSIGYLRVGTLLASSEEEQVRLAGRLHQWIQDQDDGHLVGWVVDLRGNGGGMFWAMLAGIGPLVGEGVSGYFGPLGGKDVPWSYRNGAASYDGKPQITVKHPYRLRQPRPRVAVLTDGAVGSSAEGMTISFRGRPNTRSFGSPTCGVPTGLAYWDLSDGSALGLAMSFMTDRRHHRYDGPIAPDEAVDAEHVVQRAVEWLTAPGGKPSAARAPR